MGIMDKILSQFIEVIEWTDQRNDTLVYRFPVYNKEIKMGAQLTVRESQTAVFINVRGGKRRHPATQNSHHPMR